MKPQSIKQGSTLYLVAPSFGCTTSPYLERMEVSLVELKKMGYNIIEGKNIYKAKGIASSNTPKARAKEIMDAFKSDADAIISVGGGEVMIEILEYLDFKKIKENPKWFVGFSDNTNLIYPLVTMCDIEAIYGAHANAFYKPTLEYSALDTLRLLQGETKLKGYKKWQYEEYDKENPLADYHFDRKTEVISINFDKVKGRVIGGCLDCLQGLCGTRFDNTKEYIKSHKDEGIIFFFEACDLSSIGVIRALTQLKYTGWFDDVSAFVVGRSFNYYDESFGINMHNAYLHVLSPLNKPILLDAPISHLKPSLPLIVGGLAEIKYKNKNIEIEYKK